MSQLTQYTVAMTLNGASCYSVIDVEVSQSNLRQMSTFRARCVQGDSLGDQTFWSVLLGDNLTSTELQIQIDLQETDLTTGSTILTTLIVGLIDHVSMDVQTGLVEIEGRDLAARLINVPSLRAFVNQTSSEIVSALAATAGLLANVDPTTAIVGQFYQLEHSRGTLNTFSRFATAFDTIAYLAHLEGFDFWVSGSTLYFMPPPVVAPVSLVLDVPILTSNTGVDTSIKHIRFDRRVAFDAGAQVTITSWNSRERAVIQQSYSSAQDGAPNITFQAPNLTSDAASRRAQAIHDDLIGHRRVVSCELAGYPMLTPRASLQVIGSQGWDGIYLIDSVTKVVSARRGFLQSIVARATD